MPTTAHIFYIPLVLLVGIIVGIVIGRRSVLVQQAEDARQKQLAERRAQRAQQAVAPAAGTSSDDAAPPSAPS